MKKRGSDVEHDGGLDGVRPDLTEIEPEDEDIAGKKKPKKEKKPRGTEPRIPRATCAHGRDARS